MDEMWQKLVPTARICLVRALYGKRSACFILTCSVVRFSQQLTKQVEGLFSQRND